MRRSSGHMEVTARQTLWAKKHLQPTSEATFCHPFGWRREQEQKKSRHSYNYNKTYVVVAVVDCRCDGRGHSQLLAINTAQNKLFSRHCCIGD